MIFLSHTILVPLPKINGNFKHIEFDFDKISLEVNKDSTYIFFTPLSMQIMIIIANNPCQIYLFSKINLSKISFFTFYDYDL